MHLYVIAPGDRVRARRADERTRSPPSIAVCRLQACASKPAAAGEDEPAAHRGDHHDLAGGASPLDLVHAQKIPTWVYENRYFGAIRSSFRLTLELSPGTFRAMSRLRIAIAGTGFIGGLHARA